MTRVAPKDKSKTFFFVKPYYATTGDSTDEGPHKLTHTNAECKHVLEAVSLPSYLLKR